MHMYYEPKTRSFLRTNRSQFIPRSKYRASQVVCRFMQHGHETGSKKENTFPISSCCSVPVMAKDMITRNEMHYKLICMNSTCVHPYCEFGLAIYTSEQIYFHRHQYQNERCTNTVFPSPIGPIRLTQKPTCSACFFSRNSVFLSQQFSQNSVFSQFQPSFSKPNRVIGVTTFYSCLSHNIKCVLSRHTYIDVVILMLREN